MYDWDWVWYFVVGIFIVFWWGKNVLGSLIWILLMCLYELKLLMNRLWLMVYCWFVGLCLSVGCWLCVKLFVLIICCLYCMVCFVRVLLIMLCDVWICIVLVVVFGYCGKKDVLKLKYLVGKCVVCVGFVMIWVGVRVGMLM